MSENGIDHSNRPNKNQIIMLVMSIIVINELHCTKQTFLSFKFKHEFSVETSIILRTIILRAKKRTSEDDSSCSI
jgi:hypothetical protein